MPTSASPPESGGGGVGPSACREGADARRDRRPSSPSAPALPVPCPGPQRAGLGLDASPHASSPHSSDEYSDEVPLLSPGVYTPAYGATTLPSRGRRGRRPSLPSIWSRHSAPSPVAAAGLRTPAASPADEPPPSVVGGHAAHARAFRHVSVVFGAIFCVCFMTSLEANTAYLYFNWGLSEFGALASFSTVSIAQQMVYAVVKPPVAIMSDIFGRGQALLCALMLYGAGYTLVAVSTSFRLFLVGVVIQSAGTTGIQVLQSILVADMTSPRYRGLVLGAINLPYLINFALAGPLAQLVVRHASWRWGIGLYAVLVPLSGIPLLVILFTQPFRLAAPDDEHLDQQAAFTDKCRHFVQSIDFAGFALFAGGWLLILLPMTLRDQVTLGENVRYAGAGVAVLVMCGWWQTRTKTPLVPWRVLHNRNVVLACAVGLVDFASFFLSWTYISAFVQVLKGWDQTRTAYFSTTQVITMTVVGLGVGWAMSATNRFRTLLIAGVAVRLLGVGLMVRFRNARDPTYLWVLCQLLQGVGGGAVAITMQVGAQVCARPADVATVTAFQLLVTEVGAALGSAGAGLITSSTLPRLLAAELPFLPPDQLRRIYGSLPTALSYPLGSPERNGIINAWAQVMRYLCLAAFAILTPALLFARSMPNAPLRHHHSTTTTTTTTPARPPHHLDYRRRPPPALGRRQRAPATTVSDPMPRGHARGHADADADADADTYAYAHAHAHAHHLHDPKPPRPPVPAFPPA